MNLGTMEALLEALELAFAAMTKKVTEEDLIKAKGAVGKLIIALRKDIQKAKGAA